MTGKTSLDFILNPSEPPVAGLLDLHKAAVVAQSFVLLPPLRVDHTVRADENQNRFVPIRPKLVAVQSPGVSTDGESAADDEEEEDDEDDGLAETPAKSKRRKASKKKTRLCKEPDCTSLAVSRRSCVRHGGGSRCVVEGCQNGAKLRNRCFQHGGSTVCLADGCDSKAKRYGYCWCHGGGRICSAEDCNKVAAQGGLCWAHGGGNRCKLDGCTKRSYQKHGYYCKRHAMYNTSS